MPGGLSPPSSGHCPQCLVSFTSGKQRALKEECGHSRCYSCTFSTPFCTVCIRENDEIHSECYKSLLSSAVRASSASPCRSRSSNKSSSCSRGASPSPSMRSPNSTPYSNQHIKGSRAATRQGRRRSRRVSVPVLMTNCPYDAIENSVDLYGLPPDRRPHTFMSTGMQDEEEDLYSRFQLMMASPSLNRPHSSLDSKGSSGQKDSAFSTLNEEESHLLGLENHRSQSIYCPSLYASPKMGSAVIGKPPLPSGRDRISVQRRVLPPRPTSSKLNPQSNPENNFSGREWVYEEINKIVFSNSYQGQGVAITGCTGSGKTSIMVKILDQVEQSQNSSDIYSEPVSSLNFSVNSISSRVAGHHFCSSDDHVSSSVPDFVHSLGKQLCQSSLLSSYSETMLADSNIQYHLSLASCYRNPSEALMKGIFSPLAKLRRRGKLPSDSIVILVDGYTDLSPDMEEEDSTTAFILREIKKAPPFVKLVIFLRTNIQLEKAGSTLHQISLNTNQNSFNESVQRDLLQYVTYRCLNGPKISKNISFTCDAQDGGGTVLDRFAKHIVQLSKGSILYVKLILNLVENGLLVLKSPSLKVLPQNLSEIFLLMFNMKFPVLSNFERHKPILDVILASKKPLTLSEIYQIVNAGYLCQFLSWTEFTNLFKVFKDLLRKRENNTFIFFHPALRDWLLRRNRGDSQKFLCDPSTGHAAIVLKLSRLDWPLDEDKTLDLCHHIVNSNLFTQERTSLQFVSQMDLGALLVTQSTDDATGALVHPRNIFNPNIKISKLLLKAGASPNKVCDFLNSSSILGVAAHNGFTDFCHLLLQFRADPNVPNSDGDTPLMVAANAGNKEIAKMLLDNNANISSRNALKETSLVKAASNGQTEIVEVLLKCRRPPSLLKKEIQQALIVAARCGHVQIIDQFIQFKEELVNGIDLSTGDTALTAAAKAGQSEVIKCLIQWGVSKTCKTKQGESTLCCAVKFGHYEAAKLLLDYGIPIDETNAQGQTALILSTIEGHFGLMELLVSRGANLCRTDNERLTALSWACLLGRVHAVQYLIDQGGDINHADQHGRTALDLAAHNGNAAVIKILLDRGAMMEHVDLNGMRPLDRAISVGNAEAVQCFLNKGAKLGPTTWNLAASFPNIVVILLCKLKEDGMSLCRKNKLKEAAHRFSYALRKMPSHCDSEELNNTLVTLRLHLTLNLSRTKRKMNQLEEAIELANEALQLSKDSYESYYARAKAKRKGGKLSEALEDIDQALSLIPEIAVSGNIHKCLTDVRDEIITDMVSIEDPKEKGCKRTKQTLDVIDGTKEQDQIMTSSILSESGYSSNF